MFATFSDLSLWPIDLLAFGQNIYLVHYNKKSRVLMGNTKSLRCLEEICGSKFEWKEMVRGLFFPFSPEEGWDWWEGGPTSFTLIKKIGEVRCGLLDRWHGTGVERGIMIGEHILYLQAGGEKRHNKEPSSTAVTKLIPQLVGIPGMSSPLQIPLLLSAWRLEVPGYLLTDAEIN